jgi:NTP pyrophosphatase (non-canonical NTP hydrolase)
MTFNDYQQKALTTAVYTNWKDQLVCTALGLNGEAGEAAEKIKKVIRDKGWEFSQEDVDQLKKELGDVLWYLAVLAQTVGLSFEDIAQHNLEKLKSRQFRGKISGSGDNR